MPYTKGDLNKVLSGWSSAYKNIIIKELKHGANYECRNPKCNNKWISKDLELYCPKCGWRQYTL